MQLLIKIIYKKKLNKLQDIIRIQNFFKKKINDIFIIKIKGKSVS